MLVKLRGEWIPYSNRLNDGKRPGKRFIFTTNTKAENAALEANLNDSLVEL